MKKILVLFFFLFFSIFAFGEKIRIPRLVLPGERLGGPNGFGYDLKISKFSVVDRSFVKISIKSDTIFVLLIRAERKDAKPCVTFLDKSEIKKKNIRFMVSYELNEISEDPKTDLFRYFEVFIPEEEWTKFLKNKASIFDYRLPCQITFRDKSKFDDISR
jgi:hypothetical protein